ncbi:MAG: AEC family transporter [Hydrogenobacter sp.]
MLEVILLVILAYFLKKVRIFKEEDAKVLINYIIYITLPAVSFRSAHSLGINRSVLVVVALAWSGIILCMLVSFLVGKALGLGDKDLRVFLLVSSFGNTAFLGYPYTLSFFGQEGLKYAVIYDSLGSFLLVSTLGFFVSIGKVHIKELLSFPPFLGLLLGFLLKDYNLHPEVIKVLDTVAGSLSPVVLFTLGLSLSYSGIKKYLPISLLALLIKMFLSVLITYQMGYLLKAQGIAFKVSLLESGMPSMMMAGILSLRYGLNYELAFATVGLGLLLSFITLPIFMRFLVSP